MENLKAKLTQLGISAADIGEQAGKNGAAVSVYLSDRKDVGCGPEWVEKAIREVLTAAAVPAAEVEDLIGDWKSYRLNLKGTEMETPMTTEEEVRTAVKTAWSLPMQATKGIEALRRSMMAGAKPDREQIERSARAQTEDLLTEGLVAELTLKLWAERLQDAIAAEKAGTAKVQKLLTDAEALELAIAGVGDVKLLEECKALGVEAGSRLQALRGGVLDAAMTEQSKARDRLDNFNGSPLHPHGTRLLRFADNLEDACRIMAAPWEAEDPAVTLELFHLRKQITEQKDLTQYVREVLLSARLRTEGTGVRFALAHYWTEEAGQPVIVTVAFATERGVQGTAVFFRQSRYGVRPESGSFTLTTEHVSARMFM